MRKRTSKVTQKATQAGNQVLNAEGAAALLGVSARLVLRLARAGTLPGRKVGKEWRFTVVCDEPFYAHYLLHTGAPHPGAAEIMRRHETDWRRVLAFLLGTVPEGKQIFFQKHMAHHLLPHMGEEWLPSLTHCFLIRDPGETLLSLDKILSEPGLRDTGLPQQVKIFEEVLERTGETPPVIDSRDLLENPEGMLTQLCELLDVPFRDTMLSWAAGR